ncbi:hypothetical protein LUCX_300 [Xanthomonas phage vB_XciM_LucasX]|nr:hypothetical protein LUCX_300 [Xanthomonas phage vB_XciM_LucasX]
MALGTRPSFSQVRAFFNGPANLSAYVRGGAYVPNIPANANISTTVNGLRLSQFSGADNVAAPTINASNNSPSVSGSGRATNPPQTLSFTVSGSGGNGSYTWNGVSVVANSGTVTSSSASMSGTTVTVNCNHAVNPGDYDNATVTVRISMTSNGQTVTRDINCSFNYTHTGTPI